MFTRNLEEAQEKASSYRAHRGQEWGRFGRITETVYGGRVVRMNGRDRNGAPLYRVDAYVVTVDPLFDMSIPAYRSVEMAVEWETRSTDDYGNPVIF